MIQRHVTHLYKLREDDGAFVPFEEKGKARKLRGERYR